MKNHSDESNDKFLQHIRETFDSYEAQYNPSDWENLKHRMPKGSRHMPERGRLVRQTILYSFILFFVAFSWLGMNKFQEQHQKISKQQESSTPDKTLTYTNLNFNDEDADLKESKSISLSSNTNFFDQASSKASKKNKTLNTVRNLRTSQEGSLIKASQTVRHEVILEEDAIIAKQIASLGYSTAIETSLNILSFEKIDSVICKTDKKLGLISASQAQAAPLYYAVGIGVGQQVQKKNDQLDQAMNLQVEMAIPLKKSLRLSLGLTLNQFDYHQVANQQESKSFNVSDAVYDIPVSSTNPVMYRRINTINLPVGLNFELVRGKNYGLQLQATANHSALFHQSLKTQVERVTITPQASQSPDVQVEKANSSWRSTGIQELQLFNSASFGVEVTKKLTPRTALALGAFTSIPLREGTSELPALHTVGLNMKLLYLTKP